VQRNEWVGRVGIVWSCWVHHLFNVRRGVCGCVLRDVFALSS
jgi:hypothetical protein